MVVRLVGVRVKERLNFLRGEGDTVSSEEGRIFLGVTLGTRKGGADEGRTVGDEDVAVRERVLDEAVEGGEFRYR